MKRVRRKKMGQLFGKLAVSGKFVSVNGGKTNKSERLNKTNKLHGGGGPNTGKYTF